MKTPKSFIARAQKLHDDMEVAIEELDELATPLDTNSNEWNKINDHIARIDAAMTEMESVISELEG